MQRAAKGELIGAAPQGLFGGKAGKVGIVVLLGEVREHQVCLLYTSQYASRIEIAFSMTRVDGASWFIHRK